MVMVFVKITSKGNTGTNDSAMYQTAGERAGNDGEGRGRGTWFLSLCTSVPKRERSEGSLTTVYKALENTENQSLQSLVRRTHHLIGRCQR